MKMKKMSKKETTQHELTRTDLNKIWNTAEGYNIEPHEVEALAQKEFRVMEVKYLASKSVANLVMMLTDIGEERLREEQKERNRIEAEERLKEVRRQEKEREGKEKAAAELRQAEAEKERRIAQVQAARKARKENVNKKKKAQKYERLNREKHTWYARLCREKQA